MLYVINPTLIWYPKSFIQFASLLAIMSALLFGCASSNVSRDAAANVDLGMQNAKNLWYGETDFAEAYQNTSQAAKGIVLGGAAGAITGSLTSGVGILPAAAVGAIFGGAYGRYIDANTTLEDLLIDRGVNIIVLGDQILIVIPSSRLFQPRTARIKPHAYNTLYLVTCYINRFVKMLVKVAAYTDVSGSNRVDLALSQQQAQSVAKFFESSGVNARLLYAVGYGGARLVSPNNMDWDSDNYRIEITLEKLHF